MTSHPLEEPAPRQMVAALPTLAAEALLTLDAPNPTPRPARGRTAPESRPPTNLDGIDLLRRHDPDGPGRGWLWAVGQCSRLVADDLAGADHDALDQLGPLPDPSTWPTECGWLDAAWGPWWPAATPSVSAEVCATVRDVWRGLTRLTRPVAPLLVTCVRVLGSQPCGGRIVGKDEHNRDTADLAASAWCYCAHCGQTYTYAAEIRRLGQLQRLPLSVWADELGLPVDTLRKRVQRLRLPADGRDRWGRLLFDRESIGRLKDSPKKVG